MPRTNMSLSWGPHRNSMAYASSQDHAISHRLWLPGFGDDRTANGAPRGNGPARGGGSPDAAPPFFAIAAPPPRAQIYRFSFENSRLLQTPRDTPRDRRAR